MNKIRAALFLMALVLSGCGLNGCDDCYEQPPLGDCENALWENVPIKIIVKDDFQYETVKKINGLFEKNILLPIYQEQDRPYSINIVIEDDEVEKSNIPSDKVALAISECNIKSKTNFSASIFFRKESYDGSQVARNILAHEIFHAIGYHHHEDGIMCSFSYSYESDLSFLFNESNGLKNWVKLNYL